MKLIHSGNTFSRLTTIANTKYLKNGRTRPYVLCECLCGVIKEIDYYNLISGKVKSCGCLNYEHKKGFGSKNKGKNHPRWKGGKKTDQKGYTMIYAPNNKSSNINGYIQEHRMIAEKVLGRQMKNTECIHHIDGNKSNNLNNNLIICNDWGFHQTIHKRSRAYKACGNAKWLKCPFCKKYDDPLNMAINKFGYGHHRDCFNKYDIERKLKWKIIIAYHH